MLFSLRSNVFSNNNNSIKSKDNSSGEVDSGLATPNRGKITLTDKPANIKNEMLKATGLLTRTILPIFRKSKISSPGSKK
jgi:hypothetical protein